MAPVAHAARGFEWFPLGVHLPIFTIAGSIKAD